MLKYMQPEPTTQPHETFITKVGLEYRIECDHLLCLFTDTVTNVSDAIEISHIHETYP